MSGIEIIFQGILFYITLFRGHCNVVLPTIFTAPLNLLLGFFLNLKLYLWTYHVVDNDFNSSVSDRILGSVCVRMHASEIVGVKEYAWY